LNYQRSSNEISLETKSKKLIITLIFIIILISFLLNSVLNIISSNRKLPAVYSSSKELAIRGDIKSIDNFKISTSKKIYKATIDTRYLDLNKTELFVTLFSIYSGIPKNIISKKLKYALKNSKGYFVLSYNISSRDAKNLKSLAYKLRRLHVFKHINNSTIIIGLDIKESGEKRLFPYKDTLTPVIGYLNKYETKNYRTKVIGKKGLEHNFNKQLNNIYDGILKGERDVLSRISFNKNSIIKNRQDGATINLNISLKLQKNIEMMLDIYKKKFKAKEIIVAVMESQSGKILSLASSNRYNPQNIQQSDIDNGYLATNAIEYQFEPGSVMKPISIALVLDKGLIKDKELLQAYNTGSKKRNGKYKHGIYKIGKWKIKDEHQFSKHWLSVDDILVYSSNIGTLQLAQRLNGKDFYNGYKKFGFSQQTGIELPYEKKGNIHSIQRYITYKKDNINKATASYGHGITVTFLQLLKAYTVFNNDGKIVTPYLVNNIKSITNKPYLKEQSIQIIKKSTANEIKRILIKTVQKGTGRGTIIENIEIGGKTGTANISNGKSGYSSSKYISSFFGFANDENNKYTIGVTIREPISRGKNKDYYYASKSAVPVFKNVVKTLVKLNYLKPKIKNN
jgi:cell division protein FtsI (penicillin-binding protein 3)